MERRPLTTFTTGSQGERAARRALTRQDAYTSVRALGWRGDDVCSWDWFLPRSRRPRAWARQESLVSMVTGSGPVVQFVLYLLILFSVFSWGIIFYKLRQIRVARAPVGALHRDLLGHQEPHHDPHRQSGAEAEPGGAGVPRRLPGAGAADARQAPEQPGRGRAGYHRARRHRQRRARHEARHQPGDHAARTRADVSGDHGERDAVHRPVRHRVGHHDTRSAASA